METSAKSKDKDDGVQLPTRYQCYMFAKRHLRGTSRPQVFPIGSGNQEPSESNAQGNDIAHTITNSEKHRGSYIQNPKLNDYTKKDTAGALIASQYKEPQVVNSIRRLTPTEYERLQGFPDGWTKYGSFGIETDERKCVKQETVAVIVNNGNYWVGSNWCETPQKECPRGNMPTGVGYELCRDVCHQKNHAEIDACLNAGKGAYGGTLYLLGHTYCCDSCKKVMDDYGIKKVVVGKLPKIKISDTQRYKCLGNTITTNVVQAIMEKLLCEHS